MSMVYEAQYYDADRRYRRTEHGTAAAATEEVERAGSGHVVSFHVSPNLPGCLPALVYRSTAMWTLDDGKWFANAIHGGTGERYAEERPH